MIQSLKEEVVETINKLFVYTDSRDWEKLQNEVFTGKVDFDMTSMGGAKGEMTSIEICEMWREGFKKVDSVNHLAGNFIVSVLENNIATVFAYATATHYKKAATKGNTREFVGTYDIELLKQHAGWRIVKFKYTLKFSTGNLELV